MGQSYDKFADEENADKYQEEPDLDWENIQYTMPPNWKVAEEHCKSRLVAPEFKEEELKEAEECGKKIPLTACPCCGFKIHRKKLSLWCDISEFSFLGSGYPLFFIFIKYCLYLLLTILIINGGLSAYIYMSGSFCEPDVDGEIDCKKNGVSTFSYVNIKNDETKVTLQGINNLATIFIIIVFLQFFRKAQKQFSVDCDVADISTTDYSVIVKKIPTNLGENVDYDDEIKKYFENGLFPKEKEKLVVTQVNLAYNTEEKVQLLALEKEYQRDLKKNKNNQALLTETESKLKGVQDKLTKINNDFINGLSKTFCGIAFVSFETEQTKDRVLEAFNTRNPNAQLLFKNAKIAVEPAPNPNEVYWENQSVTLGSKIIRRVISFLVTLITLLACGCVIFYLLNYQEEADVIIKKSTNSTNSTNKNKTKVNATSPTSRLFLLENNSNTTNNSTAEDENFAYEIPLLVTLIGPIVSCLIVTVNIILENIAKALSEYEKFSTRTGYNISLAKKLSIAQFANTTIVTFLVCVFLTKNFYYNGGLIFTQFMVFISNAIIAPSINISFPAYIIGQLKRWFIVGKRDELMTQEEAHELAEFPQFEIAKFYAQIMQTMYLTAFYAPILPLGSLVSIIALIIHYWIHKYNLLRKCNIKFALGDQLSAEMTEMLEYFCIIFSASYFIFYYQFFEKFDVLSIIGLIIGLANAFLPMQWINEKIFTVEEAQPLKISYYQAEFEFDSNYDRENPATKEKGIEKYDQLCDAFKKGLKPKRAYNDDLIQGSPMQSANTEYQMDFKNNSLIITKNNTNIWSHKINEKGKEPYHLKVTQEGKILITDSTGKILDKFENEVGFGNHYLLLEDDGELELFDTYHVPYWKNK